jgi:hypothetical protein
MFWKENHTIDAVTRRHEEIYERLIRVGAPG